MWLVISPTLYNTIQLRLLKTTVISFSSSLDVGGLYQCYIKILLTCRFTLAPATKRILAISTLPLLQAKCSAVLLSSPLVFKLGFFSSNSCRTLKCSPFVATNSGVQPYIPKKYVYSKFMQPLLARGQKIFRRYIKYTAIKIFTYLQHQCWHQHSIAYLLYLHGHHDKPILVALYYICQPDWLWRLWVKVLQLYYQIHDHLRKLKVSFCIDHPAMFSLRFPIRTGLSLIDFCILPRVMV